MNARTSSLGQDWRQSISLLTLLLIWTIYWYWDTSLAMYSIWMRSDTYAHAFVVPPISLWLIWQNRQSLLAVKPQASWLLAIPLLLTSFLWLLGELTAVNAMTQFALVATIVVTTVSILGARASKLIAFPLAFLFFAVPIGDFMMPKLMEWTAAFTVLALRTSGIPVYQHGLMFVIPSGNWSVVEACSGIRYIIASVTVGTLFAYLNYTSLRRRLIFIAVAIAVPVIANWLRAYIIVMLGHLSGNKLATGVDHLVYGWLFFGIVIMVMFAIGARWSEPRIPLAEVASIDDSKENSQTGRWWVALMVALLAAAGPLYATIIQKTDRPGEPVLGTLTLPPEWSETEASISWKPAFANPSTEFRRTYAANDKQAGVYIAYYRNQDFQRKLITSTNGIVSAADTAWSIVSHGEISGNSEHLPAKYRSTELLSMGSGPETRLVVWQWYWINGKLTNSDIEAKWATALSRLRGQGDDSAVIMIYAPRDQSNEALSAFARSAAPEINRMLARASVVR